jgi:hypothetical protein
MGAIGTKFILGPILNPGQTLRIFSARAGERKENHRIVGRVDNLTTNFASMIQLACAMRDLRKYFSYKA